MEGRPTIKIVGPNMSIFIILGVIFTTLKLCKVIDWSWWFVLMPFYLPLGLFLAFALIFSALVTLCLWVIHAEEKESDRLMRKDIKGKRK